MAKKKVVGTCRNCGRSDPIACSAGHPCYRCCGCIHCTTCTARMTSQETLRSQNSYGHFVATHRSSVWEKKLYCRRCGGCKRSGCSCGGRWFPHSDGRIPTSQPSIGQTFHTARSVSVEVEASNWGRLWDTQPSIGIGYNRHQDSSVTGGYEMTVGVGAGEAVITNLAKVAALLKQFDCETDRTCGYHVHVDARDWDYFALRRLLLIWPAAQEWLFREGLVRPDRKGCVHALPIMQHRRWSTAWQELKDLRPKKRSVECPSPNKEMQGEIKRSIIRLASGLDIPPDLTGGSKKAIYRTFQQWAGTKPVRYTSEPNHIRYCDLNLHSWFFRGTLEFRLKEGTVIPKEVVGWPLWCLWLVEAVGKTSGQGLPRDAMGFREWFEKRTPRWLWTGYIEKGPHYV